MSKCGILSVCFDTFSSRNEYRVTFINNYNQSCSIDFRCYSFTGDAPRKGKRIPLNIIRYNEQRDEETGYGYFGARYMDHELMTMWLSVDPMADKYPSISPYAYCAWNPVKLVDPDGREIWLPSGKEYKANMDATGLDESDAAVVNALNEICKSDEGLLMINKLCSPGNEINVDLTHGETKNTATGPKESFYDEGTGIPGTGLNINVDIEWNLNNPEAIPTVEGMQVNATYNLLDEICHAYDYCTGYGTNAVFNKNCDKGEMQAVYRSNVVRHQLGDNNYRTRYYVTGNSGSGPITAKRGEFYRPCWYPKAKTDNTSISMQY